MLNNSKKQNITLSLGILAVLAFGVMIIPASASAYIRYDDMVGFNYSFGDDYGSNYQTPYNTYNNYYPAPIYNPAPIYVNPAPAAPVYVNPAPPATVYVNPTPATKVVYTYPKTTTKTVAKTTTANTYESGANLAANAIFGADGFMPTSLIQWVLIAILILLIVILVRKISGGAEKYHATPLKHS